MKYMHVLNSPAIENRVLYEMYPCFEESGDKKLSPV